MRWLCTSYERSRHSIVRGAVKPAAASAAHVRCTCAKKDAVGNGVPSHHQTRDKVGENMHSRYYQSRKCSALHLLYARAERAEDPIRPQARRRRRDNLRIVIMSYNKNGRRKL